MRWQGFNPQPNISRSCGWDLIPGPAISTCSDCNQPTKHQKTPTKQKTPTTTILWALGNRSDSIVKKKRGNFFSLLYLTSLLHIFSSNLLRDHSKKGCKTNTSGGIGNLRLGRISEVVVGMHLLLCMQERRCCMATQAILSQKKTGLQMSV